MKNACCLFALFFSALASGTAGSLQASEKKGFGGDASTTAALKGHWFYNWTPRGQSQDGVEFVPMVKGKWDVNPGTLNAIKSSGAKVLLTFNEPERANQGNVTVAEALNVWPQLVATGLKLGSPAPSSDGRGSQWLDQFMTGAQQRKLRVDFLAVHWYRSANPRDFEAWLAALHQKWHRPIWITEFNAMYSGGDRVQFARQSFRILNRLHYVERYAYFSAPTGQPGSLWKDGAHQTLTPLGEDYVKQ